MALMSGAQRAPLALWIYGAFCLVVVAFDFATLLPVLQGLRETVLPFTGWSLSTPYLFSLIFVTILVFGRRRNSGFVWGMVAFHVLYILFGLYGIATQPQHATTNPYLIVSPYRIVWVALVPALWILVIRSRKVREFAAGSTALPSELSA